MADEAERARAESIRQGLVSLYDNGELAEIIVRDHDGQELTAVERFRLGNLYLRTVIGYQTSFRQLPREELEPMKNLFRRWDETSPSWKIAWEQYRSMLDPDFVEWMEADVINR